MHQRLENNLGTLSSTWLGKKIVELIADAIVGNYAEAVTRTTTVLAEGYGKLLSTIHKTLNLNVKFGVEISSVDRKLTQGPNFPLEVTYTQNGGSAVTESYDFLMWAGPLKHSVKYFANATDMEKTYFGSLQEYVLATTLYNGDSIPGYHAPIMYNTKVISQATAEMGNGTQIEMMQRCLPPRVLL